MPSFLDDPHRFDLEEPDPAYGEPRHYRDLRPREVIEAEHAAERARFEKILEQLREDGRRDRERAAREDAERAAEREREK